MPVQINPVDFRGFSLGGAGNVQLPTIGALGLQAIQARMSQQDNANNLAAQERMNMARVRSNDEAMLRQNILERQKLNQQQGQFDKSYGLDKSKLGLLAQQNAEEMLLKRDALDQNAMMDDRKINLAEVEQKYNQWKDNRKLAQEGLKMEMAKLKGMKEAELNNLGAFAVNARMSMDKVDPSGARTLQLSILDEAVKNGYISEDMAKQMRGMPVSNFKNALDFKILQLDKVKEYQAMNKVQNPSKGSGGIEIIQPDGTVVKMQGLNTAVSSETQKKLMNKEIALTQFDKLEKEYDPDYFTYANQAGAKISKEAEKLKGIPILEQGSELLAKTVTGKTPEERAEFIKKRTSYMTSMNQLFDSYRQEITGAGAGLQEIDRLQKSFVNGEMSPSELKGALEQIVTKYKAESDRYKSALGAGVEVNSKSDYFRQGLKAKGYSDDEINAFLKSKGL